MAGFILLTREVLQWPGAGREGQATEAPTGADFRGNEKGAQHSGDLIQEAALLAWRVHTRTEGGPHGFPSKFLP